MCKVNFLFFFFFFKLFANFEMNNISNFFSIKIFGYLKRFKTFAPINSRFPHTSAIMIIHRVFFNYDFKVEKFMAEAKRTIFVATCDISTQKNKCIFLAHKCVYNLF